MRESELYATDGPSGTLTRAYTVNFIALALMARKWHLDNGRMDGAFHEWSLPLMVGERGLELFARDGPKGHPGPGVRYFAFCKIKSHRLKESITIAKRNMTQINLNIKCNVLT